MELACSVSSNGFVGLLRGIVPRLRGEGILRYLTLRRLRYNIFYAIPR